MADAENSDQEQPLFAHLIELRNRLMKIVLMVMFIFVCLFYFSNDIYSFVSEPLQALLPENSSMIATDVASPFFAPFKLTLMVSLLLAMPVVLFQVWGFIAPGLYSREKRFVLPLFISSVFLFYLGISFAYFVVFPLIFGFFTTVGPENVTVMTDISSYLDFVLKLFFAFGVAFEIPIAVVILCWMGIVSPASLADKRPYVVVGCFVVGMLLTPPDIISQSLLAIPMWLLFEVGIVFGRLVAPKSPQD
ncbi:MAG: twin-arginine protein translocation system subunit TatC [Gammaproteobacteria bacterium BRH_c0]|nr:MAG: twin-arginine protein translocation system subunit TatC [Gammaproteobacteria bacterium BRH_c0]